MKAGNKKETAFLSKQKMFILLVAVVMGFTATFLVNLYIEGKISVISGGSLVPVVFASGNIPPQTAISNKMLEVRKIPESYLAFDAVPEKYKEFLIGQKTHVAVKKGQAILWTNLQLEDERSLSQKLNINERAITVRVDEVSGINGLVMPGDNVDILGFFDIPSSDYSETQSVAKVLLQKVLVLAVGDEVAGTKTVFDSVAKRYEATEKLKAISDFGPDTVTLRVTPEEANLLAFAEEKGHIRLVLRSREDIFVRKIDEVGYEYIMKLPDANMRESAFPDSGDTALFTGGREIGSAQKPSMDFIKRKEKNLPRNMKELKDLKESYDSVIDEVSGD